MSPERLAANITVDSKNDTRILEVKVRDTSPERSMQLSNKICEVFVRESVNITKTANVSIVDAAEVPKGPVEPKPIIKAAIIGIKIININFFLTIIRNCLSSTMNHLFEILILKLNTFNSIPFK